MLLGILTHNQKITSPMNKEKFCLWDFAFLVSLSSNRISKLSNIFHKKALGCSPGLQSSLQAPVDLYQGQVLFESSCRVRNILISSDLNILLRFTSTSTKIKTEDEDDGDDQRDLHCLWQVHTQFTRSICTLENVRSLFERQ